MSDEVPVSRGARSASPDSAPAEEALRKAVAERIFPGAAACAGTSEGVRWASGVGRLDYRGGAAVEPATIYDLASLTKVVATTSVAMRLVEMEKLRLDLPARELLPGFRGDGKEQVRIEHLLTHSSGLPAWRPLFREARGRQDVLEAALSTPLQSVPGLVERYSDLGMIVLGECLARAAGKPLAALTWELVLDPLAMRETWFRPPRSLRARIAPTEEDRQLRGGLVHGEVHDENAWALGGVSGHAGLFSTVEDLGRFALDLLRAVRGDPRARLFTTATARLFTARRGIVAGSSRALGWDTRSDEDDGSGPKGARSSSGRRFRPGSFGHTGFTGTSIWIDPAQDIFAILLTNRVHPSRAGEGMLGARRAFHDAVAAGLDDPVARRRLEAVLRDLAEAWFVVERDGTPIGHHRLSAELTAEGTVKAGDAMVLRGAAGPIALHSEVVVSADLLHPLRARGETRLGRGEGPPAMEGSVELTPEELRLSAEVRVDGTGSPLAAPRVHRGSQARPPGPILFQSLVPLLLAVLPEGEDGSGLGELTLLEFPADLDRLIAIKKGRRLAISTPQGGGRTVEVRAKDSPPARATLRFGPLGDLRRIELTGEGGEAFVERRASKEEALEVLRGL